MLQLNGTGWQKVEIFGNPKATLPQLGHLMHLIHHLLQSKLKINPI
jgi:hypothetical protein